MRSARNVRRHKTLYENRLTPPAPPSLACDAGLTLIARETTPALSLCPPLSRPQLSQNNRTQPLPTPLRMHVHPRSSFPPLPSPPIDASKKVDKDPVAGGAPYSDQALTQAQQQQQKQSDGDGASNGGPSGVGVRTLGQLDPLVVAGVALYVGTVYVFWESFRSYFDWSESLAISFIVRGAYVHPWHYCCVGVCVPKFAKLGSC